MSGSLFYDSWLDNARFTQANLTGVNFNTATLTDADLRQANLTKAFFYNATLTNANLSETVVNGTVFRDTTSRGLTKEQLYSTASYQNRNLQGIVLDSNDLSEWNFTGQDLTNASLR